MLCARALAATLAAAVSYDANVAPLYAKKRDRCRLVDSAVGLSAWERNEKKSPHSVMKFAVH